MVVLQEVLGLKGVLRLWAVIRLALGGYILGGSSMSLVLALPGTGMV